jgi:GDP-L-fucose synthase
MPATFFVDNILMTINALEACRLSGISRVILILSTASYTSLIKNPKEDNLHSGPILTDEYGYGYAKRMFEVLMRSYNAQYEMHISCVLVNGIIGANMNFDENVSLLTPSLIKRFYEQRLDSAPIEIWGDGTPMREFTSARDLATALLWCVRNQEVNTLLNIGNTEKVSVKELAVKIANKMNIDVERLYFDGRKNTGKFEQTTNNKEFIRLSGFKYSNLDLALDEAINFYIESKDAIENNSL